MAISGPLKISLIDLKNSLLSGASSETPSTSVIYKRTPRTGGLTPLSKRVPSVVVKAYDVE